MLTYINIKENGDCDYRDGFCCGSYHRIPTREELLRHFSDGWYNERDIWIGDKRNAKARYVREQWMNIVEEFESGNIKPGLRIGWFRKSDKKVADKIEKFRAALRKIGYDVDDGIVNKISRNKEKGK